MSELLPYREQPDCAKPCLLALQVHLAISFPRFHEAFSSDQIHEHFLPMAFRFLSHSAAAVRPVAAEGIASFFRSVVLGVHGWPNKHHHACPLLMRSMTLDGRRLLKYHMHWQGQPRVPRGSQAGGCCLSPEPYERRQVRTPVGVPQTPAAPCVLALGHHVCAGTRAVTGSVLKSSCGLCVSLRAGAALCSAPPLLMCASAS